MMAQGCRLSARCALDDGKIVKTDDQLKSVHGFLMYFRKQFSGYEKGFCLRMFQYVLDLAFGKIRKHRHCNHAEGGCGEIGYAPVRHVLGQQSYQTALTHPVLKKEPCSPAGFYVELTVGVSLSSDEA